ncbi:hypothetical protein ACWDWS_02260 [Streptomyces sp. NPDC003328]
MAIAKKIEKTTVERTVTLTLNVEEAQAVLGVLAKVSGSSIDSPRKHTDAVYSALVAAGVVSIFSRHISSDSGIRFLTQSRPRY